MKTQRTFCACFVALAFTRLALGIMVALAFGLAARANNDTWIGTNTLNRNGIWGIGADWLDTTTPGGGDQATFNLASTYTVTFSADPLPIQALSVTAGNVTFSSGVGSPRTLNVTSASGGQDVTISGSSLTLGKTISLTAGDELNVQLGGTFNANAGDIVNANGNVTIDGGIFQLVAGSTFALAAGKTMTMQNGGRASFNGDYSAATNAVYNIGGTNSKLETLSGGALNVNGGAQVNVTASGLLSLSGNLEIGNGISGTLSVNGAGANTTQSGAGTLTVGHATTGTAAVNVGTTASGGTLTTGSGLFTINKTGTVSVGRANALDETLDSGTLNANGDVTVDGGVLHQVLGYGGTFLLAPGKTFTVQNGGRFTIDGHESLKLSSTFTTSPNAIYNVTGANSIWEFGAYTQFVIGNGAQVNVSSGGLIFAVGGVTIDGGVLSAIFSMGGGFGVDVGDTFAVQNGGRATYDANGGLFEVTPGNYNVNGTNSKWEIVDGVGFDISNGVTVTVGTGGLLSVTGYVQTGGGTLTIDGGTVTADTLVNRGVFGGGIALNFNSGTLGITGTAGLSLGPATAYFGTNYSLGTNHTLNVTNTTTIPVGSSLAVDGGTFNTSSLVVNGVFSFGSGALGITGPAGLTVGAGGALGSTLALNANSALHVTNTLTVNSGAYLSAAGGLSTGNLINNGDVVVINSSVGGPVVNNHNVTVVGSVDFNGLVSGPGNFYGPGTAHFNGGMSPGASPATVSFEGNVAMADTNTLFIEIGGSTPGSQYDRLTIAGSATLDGALNLSLINGFMPNGGQQFTILTAGSIVDNGFVLTGSAASLFNLVVNGTTVILQAIALPGDYNQNGVVDAADYVVWRKNQGTTNVLPNDLIGGTIGTAQYNQWRANFGKPAPGAGSGSDFRANVAVPEPATLVLLMFAAAGWYPQRRRAA